MSEEAENFKELKFFGFGGAVYAQCSACHGAGGGGGVGYQLNDGEVIKTFPDVESHVAWVVNGSSAAGTPYGDPNREGGQREQPNRKQQKLACFLYLRT